MSVMNDKFVKGGWGMRKRIACSRLRCASARQAVLRVNPGANSGVLQDLQGLQDLQDGQKLRKFHSSRIRPPSSGFCLRCASAFTSLWRDESTRPASPKKGTARQALGYLGYLKHIIDMNAQAWILHANHV